MIGQEFQGDEATEAGVLCLVDDTHSAGAQFFQDEVVRDNGANHDWGAAPPVCEWYARARTRVKSN